MASRKIAPVSYQKLVRIFERDGFVVKRQKGDHLILTKLTIKRPLVIKTSPHEVPVDPYSDQFENRRDEP